jgi:hypothetical protein
MSSCVSVAAAFGVLDELDELDERADRCGAGTDG